MATTLILAAIMLVFIGVYLKEGSMSLARSIKRRKMLAEKGRTTCPKCHGKLVEKDGYGTVCPDCGWWKKEAGKGERTSRDD